LEIPQVVKEMNPSSAAKVSRLNDPDVLLGLSLRKGLEMSGELPYLIGEDIGIRHDVIDSTELLLHLGNVVAKPIFSCDLVTAWEMINALVFVQALIKVGFAGRGGPEDVPIMTIGVKELVSLKKRPNKLGISSKDLVK
jgi:hypothetical protein